MNIKNYKIKKTNLDWKIWKEDKLNWKRKLNYKTNNDHRRDNWNKRNHNKDYNWVKVRKKLFWKARWIEYLIN